MTVSTVYLYRCPWKKLGWSPSGFVGSIRGAVIENHTVDCSACGGMHVINGSDLRPARWWRRVAAAKDEPTTGVRAATRRVIRRVQRFARGAAQTTRDMPRTTRRLFAVVLGWAALTFVLRVDGVWTAPGWVILGPLALLLLDWVVVLWVWSLVARVWSTGGDR